MIHEMQFIYSYIDNQFIVTGYNSDYGSFHDICGSN